MMQEAFSHRKAQEFFAEHSVQIMHLAHKYYWWGSCENGERPLLWYDSFLPAHPEDEGEFRVATEDKTNGRSFTHCFNAEDLPEISSTRKFVRETAQRFSSTDQWAPWLNLALSDLDILL